MLKELNKFGIGKLLAILMIVFAFSASGIPNASANEVPVNNNLSFYLSTHFAHPSNNIVLTSNGFTPNSSVTYTYGNLSMGVATIQKTSDENGKVHDFSVTVPDSAAGVLLFTVVDDATKTHRYNSVEIFTPFAVASKALGSDAKTYFTGKNFYPNSTVSIIASGNTLGACIVDAFGQLEIGCGATVSSVNTVVLRDSKGGVANVDIRYAKPMTRQAINVDRSQSESYPNNKVHLSANGFRVNSLVDVSINGIPYITYRTNALTGHLSADLYIPEEFTTSEVFVKFTEEASGHSDATTFLINKPIIKTDNYTYRAGDQITLSGTGFNPSKTVSFYSADGTILAKKLSEHGEFSKTFNLPLNIKPGVYEIIAKDNSNGAGEVFTFITIIE